MPPAPIVFQRPLVPEPRRAAAQRLHDTQVSAEVSGVQDENADDEIGDLLKCKICKQLFASYAEVIRHVRENHNEYLIQCPACPSRFTRKSSFELHFEKTHKGSVSFRCPLCESILNNADAYLEHFLQYHPTQPIFYEVQSAFQSRVLNFARNITGVNSLEEAFEITQQQIIKIVRYYIKESDGIRFAAFPYARFIKRNPVTGLVEDRIHIPLRPRFTNVLYRSHTKRLKGYLKLMRSKWLVLQDGFESNGSGWVYEGCDQMRLEIRQVHMHGGGLESEDSDTGSSDSSEEEVKGMHRNKRKIEYLKLCLGAKRYECIRDPPNIGVDKCFTSCVALGMIKEKNLVNLSDDKLTLSTIVKKYVRHYIVEPKSYPVTLSAIAAFEKSNRHQHLKINVFGLRPDGEVKPLHVGVVTKKVKQIIINLLLVVDIFTKIRHYFLITDHKKFLSYNHGRRQAAYFCPYCLKRFSKEKYLDNHSQTCHTQRGQKLVFPEEKYLDFKQYKKRFISPISGFVDFEANMKITDNVSETADCYACGKGQKGCVHKTIPIFEHVVSGYSMLFVDYHDQRLFERYYAGDDDVMAHFFSDLKCAQQYLVPLLSANRNNIWINDEAEHKFNNTHVCHICEHGHFAPEGRWMPVRDHSHYYFDDPRDYAKAHSCCNMLCRSTQTKITIYIHNLTYDQHYLIKGQAPMRDQGEKFSMSGIPNNTESFKSLTINDFVFVDSLLFLNRSLDELVDVLQTSDKVSNVDSFQLLDIFWTRPLSSEEKKLLLKKSTFPYEYFRSHQEMLDHTHFPPPEAFSSVLKDTARPSQEVYDQAKKIFEKFEMKSMAEFAQFYNRLDVYLLACVVNKFKSLIRTEFGLDMNQYVSLPQTIFDYTKWLNRFDPMEHMPDPEMVLFCEQNIRGGISYVAKRYAKQDDRENNSILYLDACNLYGHSQQQLLPHSNYRWLSDDEKKQIDWLTVPEKEETGYIVEADLEYPPEVHAEFSNMPFLVNHEVITYDNLSNYARDFLTQLNGRKAAKRYAESKLVGSFYKKHRYVLHFRNLKQCLINGIKLCGVHRVLAFTQKYIFKPFIDQMTEKRKKSATAFEKDFYKLSNNSNYGKCIQNARRYLKTRVVTNSKQFDKYLIDPYYFFDRCISSDYVIIFFRQPKIRLDRPYATGFAILELSKLVIQSVWHNVIQRQLGGPDKVNLILSDTDSVIFEVKDKSHDQAVSDLRSIMDFSNYPTNHPLYDTSRKMKPGYFKDETCGRGGIKEICALKSKCYSYVTKGTGKVECKCKGITKNRCVKFHFNDYKKCLLRMRRLSCVIRRIRSRGHVLSTIMLKKRALSSFDDKRKLLSCGICTLPYGSSSWPLLDETCNREHGLDLSSQGQVGKRTEQ